MKRIPLFLVLTLAAAWGYTSWYWYTCNIKWACQQEIEQINSNESVENREYETEAIDREVETLSNSGEEVQKLSRWDVLVWDAIVPQALITLEENEVDELEEDKSDEDFEEIDLDKSSSWTLSIDIQTETQSWNPSEEEVVAFWDLCSDPLVWPISSGWANSSSDVLKLEKFLIANAYLSGSDWVYGNADFEAVKQLQLDYKAQMLDPWGIDAPTGYVWTTTVATINSIWCKN